MLSNTDICHSTPGIQYILKIAFALIDLSQMLITGMWFLCVYRYNSILIQYDFAWETKLGAIPFSETLK